MSNIAEETSHSAGVHCLPIPTPFAVGNVNAYLIEDDPLTLIDSGPNSATSLIALESGLAERGHRLEDIELILVTHEHIDHLGLVEAIVNRTRARVACLDSLARYGADFARAAARDDDTAAALMLRHGVAPHTVATLRAITALTRHWGAPFQTDTALRDGSVVELRDRRLRVIHAPGHSPTDTLFHDEERGVLFTADHLLASISSNALVASRPYTPNHTDTTSRRRALVEYLESLKKTRALDLEVVYGGHGLPITDHRELIDRRIAATESRAARIREIIGEAPCSAHEIAVRIWGSVATTQAYLTVSEVLGHIDLLMDRGLVQEDAGGEIVRFSAE